MNRLYLAAVKHSRLKFAHAQHNTATSKVHKRRQRVRTSADQSGGSIGGSLITGAARKTAALLTNCYMFRFVSQGYSTSS